MRSQSTRRQSGLVHLFPSRPFLFLFLVYLLGLLLFAAVRGLFVLHFQEQLADATVSEIITAFLTGVRFDQIVVLLILVPPLLVLPWSSLNRRPVRTVSIVYLTAVFSLAFLAALVDIRYYAYTHSHLNFLTVDYLDEGSVAWQMVVDDPYLSRVILFWVCFTVIFLMFVRAIARHVLSLAHRRSWAAQIVYFVLAGALAFLGIRGRANLAPIDWGVAYFSQNQFLNQMALNGVYTFGRAILEEQHDPRLSYLNESERFAFVPFDDGLDSVQALLHQDGDVWLAPSRSLLRLTRQPEPEIEFRPNIVLVLMESWTSEHTGVLGSSRGLTPHFDSLAAEGILFTNFYANGIRTNYGLCAALCSFPSLPGRAVMKRYRALHPFRALSEILGERGYYNAFAYGGDLAFDNVEGFFTQKGYDAFFGEEYFGAENAFSKWGVPDHVLFERTATVVDSLPRPFQLTVLTVSNHEPYDLPDSSLQRYTDASDSARLFNCQIYADDALGRFMMRMRSSPVFDSTIFVFTSDHARFGSGGFRGDPRDFHVPLLIYSPGTVGSEARRVKAYGSQVDIIPTLMGLLGGSYVHGSWGRDLLKLPVDDPGFAPMSVFDQIASIDRDYFYLEVLGHSAALSESAEASNIEGADVENEHPDDFIHRQRRLRTYLQVAEQLCTPSQPGDTGLPSSEHGIVTTEPEPGN